MAFADRRLLELHHVMGRSERSRMMDPPARAPLSTMKPDHLGASAERLTRGRVGIWEHRRAITAMCADEDLEKAGIRPFPA